MEMKQIDFGAMPATALKVVTRPALFFRELPKTGGLVEPLAFLLVMAAVTAVLDAFLGLIGVKLILSAGMAIVRIILFPAIIVAGAFIWSAIMQLIWKAMGSQEPFETAFRCVAYLGALMPIMTVIVAVPSVGAFLSMVGWVFFYVTASVETHKLAAQKSWLVFGIMGAAVYVFLLASGVSEYRYRHTLEQTNRDMQKEMQEMQKKLDEMQKQRKEGPR